MSKTVALLSFTKNGAKIGEKLCFLANQEYEIYGFVSSRFIGETTLSKTAASLSDWTKEWFPKVDCLIFVGACGIAVRAIAPFVKDKFGDPAVLVIDEKGKFCISLLSGHVGGANEMTQYFADLLGATPVITTATDLNQKFAVDVFAKKNNLALTNRLLAKKISAAILAGEKVGFQSEVPISDALPNELDLCTDKTSLQIYVGIHKPETNNTLWLIPKSLVLGIGCRKGTEKQVIDDFVMQNLKEQQLPIEAVDSTASIDLKAQEKGLCSFCEDKGFPFVTFSAEELLKVDGDFSPSAFVKSVTGVDNVCERSAVKQSDGKLILKKQKGNGVTLAIAQKETKLCFD